MQTQCDIHKPIRDEITRLHASRTTSIPETADHQSVRIQQTITCLQIEKGSMWERGGG